MGSKPSRSKLTPTDIASIRKETKFDDKEIREFYVDFMRKFPKGRLKRSDLIKLYKEYYPNGKPDDIVAEFFQEYDVDKDGRIDFREFLTGLGLHAHGSEDKKLKLAFGLYDIDSNGFISQHEMKKLVQAIYKCLTGNSQYNERIANSTATDLFERLDTNSDEKISLDEFMRGAKQAPRLMECLQIVSV